jgi:hypothetical protein
MMGNIMKNKIIKYIKRTKLGIVFRNIMKYDDIHKYDLLNMEINKNIKLIEEKCKLYIKVYGYEKIFENWRKGNYIRHHTLEVGDGEVRVVRIFDIDKFINDKTKSEKIKLKRDCDEIDRNNKVYNSSKFFNFESKPEWEYVDWGIFFFRLNELIKKNNELCKNFNQFCGVIRKTYPKIILKEDNLGIKRLDFQGNETIEVDKVLFDEFNKYGIIKFLIIRTTNEYEWLGKKYGYELRNYNKLTHYLRVKCEEIISERDVESFRNGGEWINKWIK